MNYLLGAADIVLIIFAGLALGHTLGWLLHEPTDTPDPWFIKMVAGTAIIAGFATLILIAGWLGERTAALLP
jgi:hypothetical protein